MSEPDILIKYFPGLNNSQIERFRSLESVYRYWNQRINVISRKDIDNLYLKHVLHSLAIARFMQFNPGCKIMDVGTGGGFPGIPLAIMFPDCDFILLDSIAKKIKVVQEVCTEIQLRNVTTINDRVENIKGSFDFAVSRAVTGLPQFYRWVRPLVSKISNHSMPNGIIALKGGDIQNELGRLFEKASIINISSYFEEEFFASKQLVYLPVK
jgi:16S rRNA (guanine527-N7)-methyltransferase